MTKLGMKAVRRRWLGVAAGIGLVAALGTPAHASGSVGIVAITKVDSTGALLPGATFDGWSCSAFDGDPLFTCISLKDYDWFRLGLTETGTTGESFSNDIVREGGWNLPVTECLVLKETAAPQGYVAATRPMLICRGPGGFTVENAIAAVPKDLNGEQYIEVGGTRYTPGLGDWTVTNVDEPRSTTISLVNTRITTPRPAAPAKTDPCNPAGTSSNIAWAGALPANTAAVTWSESGTTRTATLVDPVGVAWSDLTTAPISFTLPADSGVACPVTTPTRGIGANTGVDSAT